MVVVERKLVSRVSACSVGVDASNIMSRCHTLLQTYLSRYVGRKAVLQGSMLTYVLATDDSFERKVFSNGSARVNSCVSYASSTPGERLTHMSDCTRDVDAVQDMSQDL